MLELGNVCGSWVLPGGLVRLWLLGFAAILLVAVTRFRFATGRALRVFSIAVALQAVFAAIAIQVVASISTEMWMDFHWHGVTPLELVVMDVLSARGETQELLAWIGDPQVPLSLRLQLVASSAFERALPRASLIAAIGKACVETAKVSHKASNLSCGYEIEHLLPREPNSLTSDQGFAAGYANTATASSFRSEYPWSKMSDEGAIAWLRGMRAAQLSDPKRGSNAAIELPCPAFQHLAALVCPGAPVVACAKESARRVEPLLACVAVRPAPTPAELTRFGGY